MQHKADTTLKIQFVMEMITKRIDICNSVL